MKEGDAIEIKGVCKSFKLKSTSYKNKFLLPVGSEKNTIKSVLKDITLTIKKGEVVGIIGGNGSGKSTLLKIISRIIEPDSGTIEIRGRVASILELGMGFHQDMSGRENIYIKGAMYGFDKAEIESRMDKIIEYSGLEEYIDSPIRTYSSGMTGRLAFAIMINVDADVFLVDEILSVGDAAFSAKASQHFKQSAKNGKTILFVSHSTGAVSEICSRVIWIDDGKVKEDGPSKLVCDKYLKEMTESFEITYDFAKSNVADAQYRLAKMYREGNKVDVNLTEASEWMQKAAEQNHTQAQLEFADMLFDGIGVEQNIPAAMHYYQMAADRGNNNARIKIAMLSSNGFPDSRNNLIDAFRQLAERGNSINQYKYAELLLKTDEEGNKNEAFEWFSKSASMGNLDAKFQLGIMYRDGVGVVSNINESIKWFEEAAKLGHPWAKVSLAELYASGIKIDRDENKAFQWYLQSAESGNARSQYQVATMYRDGVGVEVNSEESKKWFSAFSKSSFVNYQLALGDILKNVNLETDITAESIYSEAAETYDSRAMFKLGMMFFELKPIPDMKNAIKWFMLAAERNNIFAQTVLGDIFSKGMGVEQNPEKAAEYYILASNNGNYNAAYNIAMMYKIGLGVKKDLKKYEEYLNAALEGGSIESRIESQLNLNTEGNDTGWSKK